MDRILVVDDNIDILHVVKAILETHGFEVMTTPKGEEALEKTESYLPQLILMDVYLSSGIDGRQICNALKQNETTKDIPVIMFSAQTKLEEVLKVCRADDFIAKPFAMKDLISKIKYHIAHLSLN
ncbi:MAG: response regulator [Ginsengibacter sp.]